jgi:hypothetical protein
MPRSFKRASKYLSGLAASALFVAGIVLGLAITALWIAFLAFELFSLLASWL